MADETKRLLVNADDSQCHDHKELGTSSLRWYALAVFSLLSFIQNAAFISFSTVVPQAEDYYGMTDAQDNRLVEVAAFIWLPAVFIMSPFIDRFGLKAGIVLGYACVALGSVIRWTGGTSYTWLMVGQIVNGLAGPVITNAPPALASQWFPLNQRATATAIAWNAMTVGVCAGFFAGPRLASNSSEIPRLNRVTAWVTIALFILSLTFPKPPKLPPTRSASIAKPGTVESARSLIRNPSFLLLSIGWGIGSGAEMTWASMLDIFFKDRYNSKDLDWVGVAGNGANVIGGLLIPTLVDICGAQRHMKTVFLSFVSLAGVAMACFTYFAFYFEGVELTVWEVGVGYIVGCFSYGAAAPLALELAAEVAFPVGEGNAAALMNLIYMLSNVASMEAGNAMRHEVTNMVVCGCTLLVILLASPTRIPIRRYTIDKDFDSMQ